MPSPLKLLDLKREVTDLYHACFPWLWGMLVHGFRLSQEAAEDLVHDAFVKLWELLQAGELRLETAKGWLCTVAHNKAVDWLRSAGVSRTTTWDESSPPPSPVVDPAFCELELRDVIERALNADEKWICNARYLHGLTHDQIASACGFDSGGTVRNRLRDIRRKLEPYLEMPVGKRRSEIA